MSVTHPTSDQLLAIAETLSLNIGMDEAEAYRRVIAPFVEACNAIDLMPDDIPVAAYPRAPGYRPNPADNKHNAWYWRTSVRGAASGSLVGKKVALKDNVMLAGVPMMSGSATLEGYVPEVDATIVTRILDAGGEIIGKAACEAMSAAASSYSSATGPIHNPYRMGHNAGGSSSGSAVVVALGEADMAIGCDQGGSIRMPAALCGIYGMKPTWGLVPYTGIMPIEYSIDHAGPMTASVRDNALLLEAIAGADEYDHRQRVATVPSYTESLDRGIEGMRIALVREGFGRPESQPAVDKKVRAAAKKFRALGAEVDEVSIPEHLSGAALLMPIVSWGLTHTCFEGDGYGGGRPDLYILSLMDRHRGWRLRADELADTLKPMMIFGKYLDARHGSRYYGKAMNLVRGLRAAYDQVLERYDLLLLPTCPVVAAELPPKDASVEVKTRKSWEVAGNTPQFNLTHHPAMSIPCGMHDGLPVGAMLVGRHFDETSIYRAAFAFEQAQDWKSL